MLLQLAYFLELLSHLQHSLQLDFSQLMADQLSLASQLILLLTLWESHVAATVQLPFPLKELCERVHHNLKLDSLGFDHFCCLEDRKGLLS